MATIVETFFETETGTFTHVVADPATNKAAIIDSVLDYDHYSGKVETKSADLVIEYIKKKNLSIEWILETHIHADHITASSYLKERLGGRIGIGSKIKEVLALWIPIFNTANDTDYDASQFDYLFEDGDIFKIGSIDVKVIHTPGHTPACSSYFIEDIIFVGDTVFMADIGTARTDFPGGNAEIMYDSVKKILSLPSETKIFMCHDYPPQGRKITWVTTVGKQRKDNILIHEGISKDKYVALRNERNKGKTVPKLLLPSIQVNLRAGTFGIPESNGTQYIKIPVNRV